MSKHPELAAEQAHLDRAYDCLDQSRDEATRLREHVESGRGGTFQARFERDVIEETVRSRLSDLSLGEHALIFGRIDRLSEEGMEAFHIGRVAVADENHDPVVVDWRAPVAEPFYRATGRSPMGLARRRHFSVRRRTIVDMEDELFGEGHLGVVGEDGVLVAERPDGLRGFGILLDALEQSRTGQLGDIVATIQAEQDEIIRSPMAGVLVVQGGPGTGKTVVALHRAAYLLYTHRFPLEDQGVLVIGPNRIFLRYIERVLPSLGEAGVEQAVLGDLIPDVLINATEGHEVARVKADLRMARVIAKAVRDRERPLRHDLVVPYGLSFLRLRAEESARIVQNAHRRFRRHNAARKFVESEVFAALAASSRGEDTADTVRERTRHTDEVREALERMWPVLTPAQLLHDLFGSKALLRLAGGKVLSDDELMLLFRTRSDDLADVEWTDADAALLDESRAVLGPKPVKGKTREEDEIRTYGHIVIDEAQDLTPMQLRMATRRSLNGSMTVVGDVAQATGPFAPDDWSQVLGHLPDRKPARLVELTVGYRIPGMVMDLASQVLAVAAPQLRPPRAVRMGDLAPQISRSGSAEELVRSVPAEARRQQELLGDGSVAVVVPDSLIEPVARALEADGVEFERAASRGLDASVSLVPVSLVKGLELDGVVVVEPAAIVSEATQGLRSLYVALTRCTKSLAVLHCEELPEPLRG